MKKLTFIFLLIIFTVPVKSQRWKLKRYEAFWGIGTINLFTDLGVSNTESVLYGFRFDFTRPSIYLGARYKFTQEWTGKFSIAYGYGHSKDITNERWEGTDGFMSNTHIIEPAATMEYYIIKEQRHYKSAAMYNRRGMLNDYSTMGLYVYSGLGGTYYNVNYDINPRASDELRKSGFALAIPLGLGLKYIYSDKIVLGYEIGPRYVFTDFLDGISPGASKHYDMYWLTSFYVSYKIKTSRRNIPIFLDRKLRRALK